MTQRTPLMTPRLFSLALLGALLISASTLTACNWFQPHHAPITSPYQQHIAQPDEVVVFFSKNSGSTVITEGVIRKLPKALQQATPEAQLKYALEQLLAGPTNPEIAQGFFSEIPKGSKLLDVQKTDGAKGEIRLNLSKDFTSGGGSNSMIERVEELKNTVIFLEKTIPVYLDVEKVQLTDLGGEGLFVDQPINIAQPDQN